VLRYRVAMRVVVATSATTVLLALAAGAGASAPMSGLRGLATLAPTRPVCVETVPCSRPAASVVLVFLRKGRVAARITTRADGTYRVLLRPGTVTVVAPAYRVGSGVTPRTVRVPYGRVVRVNLQIDTGIQ
jgi:hypothetical protein